MTFALCETGNELRDMDNMMGVFAEQVSFCKEYDGKGTGIGFGAISRDDMESHLQYFHASL